MERSLIYLISYTPWKTKCVPKAWKPDQSVTQCVHTCEKMGRSWNFLSSGCLTDLFCDDGKWFLSSNRQKYDHQTTIPWFNSLFGPVLRNRSTTYSTLSTPKSSIWWQKPLLVIVIRSVSTLYKRFWMVPNSFLNIVNTLGNGFRSHEFYEFGQELGSQSLGIGPVRLTLPVCIDYSPQHRHRQHAAHI